MSEYRSVRLMLRAPPSPAQLRGLRQSFARLADLPPAQLREWLTAWPVCVLGDVRRDAADSVVERLEALGLEFELFSWEEYTPDYLRHVLPQPPVDWESAEASIELVYRPAFEPEAIVRLWRAEEGARMHFASPVQSVWALHFNTPPWLRGSNASPDELEPSREVPCDEVVDIAPIDGLLALARALPDAAPSTSAVFDGTSIEIAVRDGERRTTFDGPTASQAPEVLEFLRRVYAFARLHSSDARSLSRLGVMQAGIAESLTRP